MSLKKEEKEAKSRNRMRKKPEKREKIRINGGKYGNKRKNGKKSKMSIMSYEVQNVTKKKIVEKKL